MTNNIMIDSDWKSFETLAQTSSFGAMGYAAGYLFKSLSLNPIHGLVYGSVHFGVQKLFSQIYADKNSDTHTDVQNKNLAFAFHYIAPAVISFGITNALIGGSLLSGGITVTAGIIMPIALSIISEPVSDWAISGLKEQLEKEETQELISKSLDGITHCFFAAVAGIKTLPQFIPSCETLKGCCTAIPGSSYVSTFFQSVYNKLPSFGK